MSITGPRAGPPTGWRGWLLDPAPASRRQARLGRWYRAWLGFYRNGLAMTGLSIVLALVLVAIAYIDQPYQGNVRVAPQGFEFALRTLHNEPSP